MPDVNAEYFRFESGDVASAIEIHPGLLFDIDAGGRVLGIERIGAGDVDFWDLAEVIRVLRYVKPEEAK